MKHLQTPQNLISQLASHKRKGSLYISVLGVTLIVSMIGLSSMMVARTQLKIAQNSSSMAEAQKLAFSAVEYGLHLINNDSSWRTTYSDDTEAPATPVTLGNGTITFKLVDDDGNLADSSTDSVRLVGIGRVDDIEYAESVLLVPESNGLTCLETALHSQGNITLGWTVRLMTNQIISSNGNITATASSAELDGPAEAVGAITGSISGTSTPGITARTMPGASVFDYYKLNGTWIDVSDLPIHASHPQIHKVVLSPASNPYGTGTNLEGIYVIDCEGEHISITNCRIEGTLLLINPGSSAKIEGSIYWTAAVGNYPALLVEGDIELRTDTNVLSEATHSTNFNPVGTPYEAVTDADTADEYPAEIHGLVYVSGDLDVVADSIDSKIDGCVVCNSIQADSDFVVNYYNTYFDYPPPGFAQGPDMAIVPGSRRRETLP